MASDCVCMCAPVFDLQDISSDCCLHGEGCFLSSEGWGFLCWGRCYCTVGVHWILFSTEQKGASIRSCTVKKEILSYIHMLGLAVHTTSGLIHYLHTNMNLLLTQRNLTGHSSSYCSAGSRSGRQNEHPGSGFNPQEVLHTVWLTPLV